jgi:hypothetical protein
VLVVKVPAVQGSKALGSRLPMERNARETTAAPAGAADRA